MKYSMRANMVKLRIKYIYVLEKALLFYKCQYNQKQVIWVIYTSEWLNIDNTLMCNEYTYSKYATLEDKRSENPSGCIWWVCHLRQPVYLGGVSKTLMSSKI